MESLDHNLTNCHLFTPHGSLSALYVWPEAESTMLTSYGLNSRCMAFWGLGTFASKNTLHTKHRFMQAIPTPAAWLTQAQHSAFRSKKDKPEMDSSTYFLSFLKK